MTIYDVARAAGVAPSTVSRTFSRPGRVSATTADRVRRVAEELGYRTGVVARALSTTRTGLIALAVSDVVNPFYSEVIRGAQQAAAASGYTILLADSDESEHREQLSLERLLPVVDGVILGGTRLTDAGIRQVAKQKPVVVLNRAVPDTACILPDTAQGVRLAVDHLVALGHRELTYVAGPSASWADGMRWRCLLETATARGLRLHRLGPYPPDVAGGQRAAEDLARRLSGAAVAYNDQVAIGLMQGLQSHGIAVPGDVSVVGFDDIAAADVVTPRLTTVAAPLRVEGVAATEHLVAAIAGASRDRAPHEVLPVRLVVRDSTSQRSR